MQGNVKATAEQVAYAKLLDLGMKVGLAALVITFAIYLTGILPPHTPVNDLPKYWKMPVKQYLRRDEDRPPLRRVRADPGPAARTAAEIHQEDQRPPRLVLAAPGRQGGFPELHPDRLPRRDHGDLLHQDHPDLPRKKDMVYTLLAITEVVVLTLAASGYLGSGGH